MSQLFEKKIQLLFCNKFQWRIQDFPQGDAPTPKIAIIFQIFAKNCMKMKEFGPQEGGVPGPPLGSANEFNWVFFLIITLYQQSICHPVGLSLKENLVWNEIS